MRELNTLELGRVSGGFSEEDDETKMPTIVVVGLRSDPWAVSVDSLEADMSWRDNLFNPGHVMISDGPGSDPE